MKNQTLLLFVVLAIGLPWTGCNKPKSDWGKAATPAASTAPAGPVELRLKWPVGGRMVQSLDISMKLELSLPNMPSPMNQEMSMGQRYALSVLKEREGGGHEVELEFLSSRMLAKSGGTTEIDFDSAKKQPKDGKKQGPPIFTKLAGSRIRYLLDASNQVETVLGLEALRKQLMPPGQRDPSGMTDSMLREEYLKQFMDGQNNLPPKPVQPGDTWSVQKEIVMGPLGTLVLDHNYTFKGWELHDQRNCARFAFEGTLTSKPNPDAKSPGMPAIESGKSSGESWFDADRGIFLQTTMDEDVQISITIPTGRRGNGAGATPPMTFTNPMTLRITAKLESAQ